MRRLVALLITLALLASPRPAVAAGVAATYPVGHQPLGVVIDPVGGLVYVSNNGGTTVSAIDPASPNPVAQTITVGSQPGVMAVDAAARRLYVSNAGDLTLSVVDLATRSVVATVADAGGLGVAVDPGAHRAYVAGATSFVVVNTTTNRISSFTGVGFPQSWWGVAIDLSRKQVYVTNMDSTRPSLVILDATTLDILGEVVLPKPVRFAMAVDEARNYVYLASDDPQSDLYVVDMATRTVVQTTALGGLGAGIALAPGKHRLYVSDNFGQRVVEVDDQTFAVVGATALPWAPYQLAVHSNGRLYVAGMSADVLGALVDNAPPVIDRVTVSPASPRTNDVVQASVVAHDADGDRLTYAYQWSRNGAAIPGATGATLDLSAAGAGDRGDVIAVEVRVSDGQAQVSASASTTVVNSAPTAAVSLSDAAPTTNAVVSATVTAADADGDALTYTFTWTVNGVVRQTTSGASASEAFDLAVAGHGDKGDVVAVDVVVSDGQASVSASASATVGNSAPTAAVSLSDAAPATNAVVTATATGSDPDRDVLSYQFTWKVNGLVRKTTSGPNASDRFDLGVAGNGDRGDTLVVEVVASDGTASSAPASASATVANTAPTVTVTLDDSTPKKNQHLTARAYGKDADGDALTFDFTWRVNGVVVGSSSGSSDTDSIFLKGLVGNGDTVTVTVLAHDASTASEPASASATVSPGGQGASDFTHTYAYAPNPQ